MNDIQWAILAWFLFVILITTCFTAIAKYHPHPLSSREIHQIENRARQALQEHDALARTEFDRQLKARPIRGVRAIIRARWHELIDGDDGWIPINDELAIHEGRLLVIVAFSLVGWILLGLLEDKKKH